MSLMNFEISSEITDVETIAVGSRSRDLARLRRMYGKGRWRKLKGVAIVRLVNGRIRKVEPHWYETHGIGKKKLKNQTLFGLKIMKRRNSETRFVICIRNEACEDLELRKVYQVLPDEAASEDGYIRVIDESGEDYLYPQEYFVPIELPQAVEKALLSAA